MNMTITGIQHEYESELEKTKRILAVLKEENKDWKPHEKSMSIKDLAAHIVELQIWFGNALKNTFYDFHSDYRPLEFSDFQELEEILDRGVKENMEFVKESKIEFWLENFQLKMGEQVLASLPRAAFLRSVLTNHLIHHRGQLTVYLRMLDIPVPGIYGPSADEK